MIWTCLWFRLATEYTSSCEVPLLLSSFIRHYWLSEVCCWGGPDRPYGLALLPSLLLVAVDTQNFIKVFVETPLYFFMIHRVGKELLIIHAELVSCFPLVVVYVIEQWALLIHPNRVLFAAGWKVIQMWLWEWIIRLRRVFRLGCEVVRSYHFI